jgi:hypothetical protein
MKTWQRGRDRKRRESVICNMHTHTFITVLSSIGTLQLGIGLYLIFICQSGRECISLLFCFYVLLLYLTSQPSFT